MVILIHILIALSSVGLASVTFFKPTMQRLLVSYGLIVATVVSGTVVIATTAASVLHACLSGLVYVTAVSIVTIATHARYRRLTTAHAEIDG